MKKAQFAAVVMLALLVFAISSLLKERALNNQIEANMGTLVVAAAEQQALMAAEQTRMKERVVTAEAHGEAARIAQTTVEVQAIITEDTMEAIATEQDVIIAELLLQQEADLANELSLNAHRLRAVREPDIEYSTLLAIEGVQHQATKNTIEALRRSFELLPRLEVGMEIPHASNNFFFLANNLLFSDDGNILLSSGYELLPKLWDTTTGDELMQLPNDIFGWSADAQYVIISALQRSRPYLFDTVNQREVTALESTTYGITAAISADGQLIAYSTDIAVQTNGDNSSQEKDYIFVVRDVQSEEEILREIINQTRGSRVESYGKVAFSSDNKYVAGANLWQLDLWDLERKQIVSQIPIALSWPESLLFSPDNTNVVIVGREGVVLWDIEEGRKVVLESLNGFVQSVRFSADSNYLIITRQERWDGGEGGSWYSGQNGTQIWKVNTGEEILRLPEMNQGASFIADTHEIVTINDRGEIQKWNVDERAQVAQGWLFGQVTTEISPDGTTIAGISSVGQIRIWSLDFFSSVQILHPATVYNETYRGLDNLSLISYKPDGSTLLTGASDYYGLVRFWDSENGHEQNNITTTVSIIDSIAYSSNERSIAIGGRNYPSPSPEWASYGLTYIWNEDSEEATTLVHEARVNDLKFSSDGHQIATATNVAQLWDIVSGEAVMTYTQEITPSNLAFRPNGEQLIVLSSEKVVIYDVQTGDVEGLFESQNRSTLWTMALHPNGRLLAIAESRMIRIWDIESDTIIANLPVERIGRRYKLQFSPDGHYLGGFFKWSHSDAKANSAINIWRSVDWISVMNSDILMLNDFAFSYDDKYVALGERDGLVRVLRLEDNKEMNRMYYDEGVSQVVFRFDSQQLALLGRKSIVLWAWNPQDWVDEACQRLSRNLTRDEWHSHFDDTPYHATCPNLAAPGKLP